MPAGSRSLDGTQAINTCCHSSSSSMLCEQSPRRLASDTPNVLFAEARIMTAQPLHVHTGQQAHWNCWLSTQQKRLPVQRPFATTVCHIRPYRHVRACCMLTTAAESLHFLLPDKHHCCRNCCRDNSVVGIRLHYCSTQLPQTVGL
jgi:hypothetical protein